MERQPETLLYGQFHINIDAKGNGTLDFNGDKPDRRNIRLGATRISTEDSIIWSGYLNRSNVAYTHKETVSNTVSVIDDDLRSFARESTGTNSGEFVFSWVSNANLTGKRINGSKLCEPVEGAFNYTTTRYNSSDFSVIVATTASKQSDDPYWRVITDTNNTKFPESNNTVEYFARNLKIRESMGELDSSFFICDFVDFQK